ncbi:hypothetical protein H650_00355 (plasmid) [Enterobacter sp. R4-368]|nr:hypothetical protein H650_00355 [Enterobacter sp. R4-368]
MVKLLVQESMFFLPPLEAEELTEEYIVAAMTTAILIWSARLPDNLIL